MIELGDMVINSNGCVNCPVRNCSACVLGVKYFAAKVARNITDKWGSVCHKTSCADVLYAWQIGKLAFIDGVWYEVNEYVKEEMTSGVL